MRRPYLFVVSLFASIALVASCKQKAHAPPLDESAPGPGGVAGGATPDAAAVDDSGTPARTTTVLAQGFAVPQGIALDASYVYFTLDGTPGDDGGITPRSGSVMRVPRAGGTPTEIASAQDYPYSIAAFTGVTTSGVAWTNRGTLQDTGGVMSLLVGDSPRALTSGEEATGLRTDGTFAYWTSTLGGANIVVERASLASGGPDTLGTLQGEAFPEALAIDAQYIYFVASGANAGVYRLPISVGASVESLAALPGAHLTDIVVVGSTLYVADSEDSGSVFSLPTNGGRTTVIASGQKHPTHLATSASTLYWTNDVVGGSVWAAPFDADAGAPHVVVSQLDRPNAIAFRDTVYFTTWDAVLKINP